METDPRKVDSERFDRVFSAIASRYDWMKTLLSAGQERRWKRQTLKFFIPTPPPRCLDLATGTGDFLPMLAAWPHVREIVAFDQNREMLDLVRSRYPDPRIRTVCGDLNALPFAPSSYDLITMGYGLRYCASLSKVLADCFRVLRPGGHFFAFDVGHPRSFWLRHLWYSYLGVVITVIGTILHGRPRIYWHLIETLIPFPRQDAVCREMQAASFFDVQCHELFNGAMVAYYGQKPFSKADPPDHHHKRE